MDDEELRAQRLAAWPWTDLGVTVHVERDSDWGPKQREQGRLVGCPVCGAAIVAGEWPVDRREDHIDWHDKAGA